MHLFTYFLMEGDGSIGHPRALSSVFPSFDLWARLVRDDFTCRDHNGNLLQERIALMPTGFGLVKDLGPVGIAEIELDPDIETQALAKFAAGISVVGRDRNELKNRARDRRTEVIDTYPANIQTALRSPTAVAQARAWLVAQNGGPTLNNVRDWLIDLIDEKRTTMLPNFMMRDFDLNWRAIAQFADMMDTATPTQIQMARLAEIIFLTRLIDGID